MRYFSFPLFKENLKRFWGLSAVAFVGYFLSNTLTIFINRNNLDDISYWVGRILNPSYFPYALLGVAVAIVASIPVFRYLTKVNSTGVIHAMPFTRASLFITNYVSGLVLALIPVFINSILLALMVRPVMCMDTTGEIYNAFTVGAVAESLLCNALSILFTYAISCIAAVISGNSVIQILTAGTLNFIAPVTYASFVFYKELFSYEYEYDSYNLGWVNLHPVMKCLEEYLVGDQNTHISVLAVLIYILVSLALSALAYYLYTKRKLERAGDSYVFDWVKYVVAAFFTYFAATLMMAIFANGILGIIIGTVVGFAIGWMIISKSFRIINMQTLKAFGISVLATLAVILFFVIFH